MLARLENQNEKSFFGTDTSRNAIFVLFFFHFRKYLSNYGPPQPSDVVATVTMQFRQQQIPFGSLLKHTIPNYLGHHKAIYKSQTIDKNIHYSTNFNCTFVAID